MSNIKIKVCGMTSITQVEQLKDMEVDYAGFIFYEPSPRWVRNKISASDLKNITGLKKVGVFVNESETNILKTIDEFGLDTVQLHGNESPEFCKTLQQQTKVIKAFRVSDHETDKNLTGAYEDSADYFLFDTKGAAFGGTGLKFNWSLLQQLEIKKPFFLSGGIGAEDLQGVLSFHHANNVFAIDLNSRFEVAPGIKNMEALEIFIKELHVAKT